MILTGYNKAGQSFNTCQKYGTVNFFDAEITESYHHAHCYHCGALVEVPELPEYRFTPYGKELEPDGMYAWRSIRPVIPS